MAETIADKIYMAIYRGTTDGPEGAERSVWLDPEDAREMAEDVARTLGLDPAEPLPVHILVVP